MQFTVESVSSLEKRVLFTLPKTDVDNKVDASLDEIKKTAKLPGFRANKVPKHIIQQQYGERARAYAIDELINQAVRDVVAQEKFNIIATPQIKIDEQETDVKFTATFEIYPVIDEINTKLTITQPIVEISDADIDEEIAKMREHYATWHETNESAAEKDKINIDFDGTIEGKPFTGGQGSGVDLILGSKMMIPGFEDALIGVKAGNTTNIDLTFPDKYPNAPELSSKAVTFAIKVNKVLQPQLPEINAELFKKAGIDATDNKAFRQHIKASLNTKLAKTIKDQQKQQVLEKLLMNNPVDVPNSMANQEAKHQRENFVKQYMGKDAKADSVPLDNFISKAKKDVAMGLLLNKFIQQHNIKAVPAAVEEEVKQHISTYNLPTQWLEEFLKNEQQYKNFEHQVIENTAINKIIENSTAIEEPTTYTDLLTKA